MEFFGDYFAGRLIDHRDDGGVVEVQLLRPRDLVESTGLKIGTGLPFELEELQVSGTALVTKISPAPEIAIGDGHAVTGRYVTRRVDEIARVEMQDETGRIGVLEGTPIHPTWSVDRHKWVRLGELEAGERLQGENGLVTVLSVDIQSRSVRVYNLERMGRILLNIEMQTSLPAGMSQRLLCYASCLYVGQLTSHMSW